MEMDDTAKMIDQIEAVTRALTGSTDSVFVLRGYRTDFGDTYRKKTHRWMLSAALHTDSGVVRLSETETGVDRPHRDGAPSWDVPPAPPYAERIAALHDMVMRRLTEHEKAIAAAKAVRS